MLQNLFYMGELQARIRVALRKSQNNPVKNEIFQQDYLTVDIEKHQVLIDGQEIHLTPIEFKIIYFSLPTEVGTDS